MPQRGGAAVERIGREEGQQPYTEEHAATRGPVTKPPPHGV